MLGGKGGGTSLATAPGLQTCGGVGSRHRACCVVRRRGGVGGGEVAGVAGGDLQILAGYFFSVSAAAPYTLFDHFRDNVSCNLMSSLLFP